MATRRFRVAAGALDGTSEVALDADEMHHVRVARLSDGDDVVVFDGAGTEARGRLRIGAEGTASVVLAELRQGAGESPLRVVVVQAVPVKLQRLDDVIRLCSELGAAEIHPVLAARSQLPGGGMASLARKEQRWQRLAESAAKQCGRSRVLRVHACVPLSELDWAALPRPLWMLHPQARETMVARLHEAPGHELSLLVGPEGGWDDREIEVAAAAGVSAVRLGPRVLRSDSAAPAALAVVQAAWGDLG